jgi:hypothetical protein
MNDELAQPSFTEVPMRLIGLAVPLPVHATWRAEPRVWRAVPCSPARRSDRNQNVPMASGVA